MTMTRPDLPVLIEHAPLIVEGVGRESVDVYLFLCDEFARGAVTQNHVFQFVYRSFYRLDSAGLTPEFKAAYFQCLEHCRGAVDIDIGDIAKTLHELPNRKGHVSLQFSFVTKLAHTVNADYAIYDGQIAKVFRFRAPSNHKSFETRLGEYLAFYRSLQRFYVEIVAHGAMNELIELFKRTYSPAAARVPPVKVLDFLFWSAGKNLTTIAPDAGETA